MNTVLTSPLGSEEYKYLFFMFAEEDSGLLGTSRVIISAETVTIAAI